MITKEKIIEILSNHSSYADSSLGNIIQEEKHDIIAEDILSKLRQPLVSGQSEQLFCECKRNNPYTGVKFEFTLKCFDCNKIIEQNNCH